MVYNMNIILILSILIGILVLSLIYISFNSIRKFEKYENIILSQNEYVSKIQDAIIFSEKRIKEIDEKETFKSDDEIGWFFDNIKNIQEILSNYKIDKNE